MPHDALDTFLARTREHWGPLSTNLVRRTRAELSILAQAPSSEAWLESLLERGPATEELARDPAHGFILLAHTEPEGLFRPPHDHGRSWVAYGLARGAIAMRTYARIDSDDGTRLVEREETLLRAGEAQLFLPGDIHDTCCVAGPALLFRFTERDLGVEDRIERRLTRYVERDGVFTTALS